MTSIRQAGRYGARHPVEHEGECAGALSAGDGIPRGSHAQGRGDFADRDTQVLGMSTDTPSPLAGGATTTTSARSPTRCWAIDGALHGVPREPTLKVA